MPAGLYELNSGQLVGSTRQIDCLGLLFLGKLMIELQVFSFHSGTVRVPVELWLVGWFWWFFVCLFISRKTKHETNSSMLWYLILG